MKNTILWVLFFTICMGVGFLHGVLPHGISKSYFSNPPLLQVIVTDEIFFPEILRKKIENNLNVKLSIMVTRDWDSILANIVSSPSVDLIFLPSFWAQTLARQGLLIDVSGHAGRLRGKLASDFSGRASEDFFFLPFYWMKTHIAGRLGESFTKVLADKKESTLFLLADEDLLLKHFQIWKDQGLWDQVLRKKILTLQLDQLNKEEKYLGAFEGPVATDTPEDPDTLDRLSALLIYGAAIPSHAANKNLALEVLDALTEPENQTVNLLQTPFNTAFEKVNSDVIPLQRRADFIRNLQLKNTLILDRKERDAKLKLRNEFNFIL